MTPITPYFLCSSVSSLLFKIIEQFIQKIQNGEIQDGGIAKIIAIAILPFPQEASRE